MIITNYIKDLFKTDLNVTIMDRDSVLHFIPVKILRQLFESMASEFTKEEIRVDVFHLNPSKAPGRDGFSALFFQKLCEEKKDQVTGEALKFLNGCQFNEEHNITQLILILKVKSHVNTKDYRPISLWVFMKIISKVLVKFNGRVTDFITLGRGLRQGDPLYPYLFIICSE